MSLHTHDYSANSAKVEDILHLIKERENAQTSILDTEINNAVALPKNAELKSEKTIESSTEEQDTFFNDEVENFIWSSITTDSAFGFESTYWIAFRKESRKPDLNNQSDSNQYEHLKSAYEEIKSFLSLEDGWDGEGSVGPKEEPVNDAIRFLDNWSSTSIIPVPELMFYGIVTLQFYCAKGRSLGAIEFNESHRGVYSVLNRSMEFESGYFDSGAIKEIESAINKILLVLQSNDN